MKKVRGIIYISIVLLLSLLPGRYIKNYFEVHSYKVCLSYWALGPRHYIQITSPNGNDIMFKGKYPDLIDSTDLVLYLDDFILPKDGSDTVYAFTDNAVIKNNGFYVETVTPPYWEQDTVNAKIYHINLGSHFGKLFHKVEPWDYEGLNEAYFRITTSGDTVIEHDDGKEDVVFKRETRLWGIIPRRIREGRFSKNDYSRKIQWRIL